MDGLQWIVYNGKPLFLETNWFCWRVNKFNLELLAANHLKMDGNFVISNHFLCKDWVHHTIDSQPFINGWPWGSRKICGMISSLASVPCLVTVIRSFWELGCEPYKTQKYNGIFCKGNSLPCLKNPQIWGSTLDNCQEICQKNVSCCISSSKVLD